jgi:uncharacterized membrane protein YjgN (DUF898 family)
MHIIKGSKLKFTGQVEELFKLYFNNTVLTFLTLGIYSAWAKVKVNNYLLSNIKINGQGFAYTAFPRDLLKARIIVFILAIIYILLSQIMPNPWIYLSFENSFLNEVLSYMTFESNVFKGFIKTIISGVSFILPGFKFLNVKYPNFCSVILIILFPFIVVQGYMFFARNVALGNINFKYHGNYKQSYKVYSIYYPLSFIFLGILLPYYETERQKLYLKNLSLGDQKFTSTIRPSVFYRKDLISIWALSIVSIITLLCLIGEVVNVESNFNTNALAQYSQYLKIIKSKNTISLLIVLLLIGSPSVFFYWNAVRTQEMINSIQTEDGNLNLRCTLKPIKYVIIALCSLFAIPLSLVCIIWWILGLNNIYSIIFTMILVLLSIILKSKIILKLEKYLTVNVLNLFATTLGLMLAATALAFFTLGVLAPISIIISIIAGLRFLILITALYTINTYRIIFESISIEVKNDVEFKQNNSKDNDGSIIASEILDIMFDQKFIG